MCEGWPFGELRAGAYRVVLCDPPWSFRTYSAKGLGKSPQRHYACALVMWATAPMLPQAVETMDAWGFDYRSMGTWAKRSRTGAAWHMGTGYVYRSASEPWLFGATGRPRQLVRNVRNLIVAPVREHSRKPPEMHAALEAMFEGPRCELFARESRPGWDTWGNEARKFDGADGPGRAVEADGGGAREAATLAAAGTG